MLHLNRFLVLSKLSYQALALWYSSFGLFHDEWGNVFVMLQFRRIFDVIRCVDTALFRILVFLEELLSVLLVLLPMLSLTAPISMAYLDSLQLVLYRTDFVFETEVLHLRFEHANYVLHFGVVAHSHLFSQWEVTHKFTL